MKLLIITQKVDKDDSYFGFFHTWLALFAQKCEQVTVLALETHSYELPNNVRVLSLGKEEKKSRTQYLLNFWKYTWKYRNDYDVVFCHMSPLYVIAGFPIWKLLHKKISLWYIHRNVDFKLWMAEKLTDVVFTASPESFRLKSKKVRYVRQAVSSEQFRRPASMNHLYDGTLRVVSVGRITAIKNLDVLIRAANILHTRGIVIDVALVGGAVTKEDTAYEAMLRRLVRELDADAYIHFAGSIPFARICESYWSSDVSVNLCPTGGMDKAVLESLAAGTPAIVSNEAFKSVLSPYEEALMFSERNVDDLVERLMEFSINPDKESMAKELQHKIYTEFSLQALIHSIIEALSYEK
jgi:glycosyltransferase involved in cell wall biosynthesis